MPRHYEVKAGEKKTWDIISSFCIETDDQMVNPLRGNPPPKKKNGHNTLKQFAGCRRHIL